MATTTHRERIDALAIQAVALGRDFCATLLIIPKKPTLAEMKWKHITPWRSSPGRSLGSTIQRKPGGLYDEG